MCVCVCVCVFWGGAAKHLDRKHGGDEQELEVSLTERKGVGVEVVKGSGGRCGSAKPTHF